MNMLMEKISRRQLIAILLINALTNAADAQQPAFTMSLPKPDDKVQPLIIGGTKADPDFWPMTFIFRNPKGGGCTSTGIGTHTILTAAHCVANGAAGVVEVAGRKATAVCTHHPDYRDVQAITAANEAVASPDFALCKLSEPLPNGLFEHVDTGGKSIMVDKKIHLLGFGCNSEGGSDGSFGVLFEGWATIRKTPTPPSYYTTTVGGAAVCYGDSGGAAYQHENAAGSARLIVGVNSRGDISKLSLISTTKEKGFVDWILAWAKNNNTRVCGVHGDASGCRPQ
jgi:hypothetical protein